MLKLGIKLEHFVVRVVSSKPYKYPAVAAMKARYGTEYPDDFPYESKCLLAFQRIEDSDVCVFAMCVHDSTHRVPFTYSHGLDMPYACAPRRYVQEYGPACPQPNTNRTYISYLDSNRYLVTEPPDQRTPVYHALINGYLRNARDRGFEHAHIWVAPPQVT